LYGNILNEEIDKIKKYYINEVESREKDLTVLEQLPEENNNEKVLVYDGFTDKAEKELKTFKKELELAMTLEDLQLIQNYFRDEEKRNPTETEIKVLDTYWSDHCRHTTFETVITDIKVEEGKYKKIIEDTVNEYMKSREYVHADKIDKKPVTLMDLATISGKEERKKGTLSDLEISDEINACSVYVDVPINGKIEKWILQFKNETHNHPTEIEPFGGASTCIGGAIRDPLSGRTFVYQAVRISGAGNPNEKIENTMEGKLPQKVITQKAAQGFSSYGNQIGLATTYVNEIYDEGYKAKRMELGLVIGAAPAENIIREKPEKDDIIILLGGRTGRDGIGGATGSSKEHTLESSEKCSAEVQKGNAVIERKIQRLFRNKEVTKLIKKCNDFGAGGVSVAIGELADGLEIDLNKVRVKYKGLNGTELAISESQERMAVVISKKNLEKFEEYARKENLEAYEVARITDAARLVMKYNNEIIVNISREFLNTNGSKSYINAEVENSGNLNLKRKTEGSSLREKFINNMKELNICSQRGLMETFDSTIGSTTVLMPYGGKYQLTPSDISVQKISVENGETSLASMAGYGYSPFIAKQVSFHGGVFAVVESMARTVAAGGNYKNIRFTFQEYFERLGREPKKWGKPLSALLGAFYVQKKFGLASIGGKDSMSGTFHEISVPPTLVSFAVSTVDSENVVSNELKKAGSKIYMIKAPLDENDLPDLEELKDNFDFITENIKNRKIISASAVKYGGIAETLAKMSFGNKMGMNINTDNIVINKDKIGENSDSTADEMFIPYYGTFVIETDEVFDYKNAVLIGNTVNNGKITLNSKKKVEEIELEELISEWEKPLENIFPTGKKANKGYGETHCSEAEYRRLKRIEHENLISRISNNYAKPRIFIPVFPGTNCEYDLERMFNREGGIAKIKVFN
ncbi:MAG: phosphoribosylformylglycinamidine synthase, partial [Leptotrichiaceae bacterium]|nr:phosphoribosylformylglycinamidine synthase [Leptotrichiaceae bacterium]